MATLVTRNQFNVTPQGVVHKPTESAFTPVLATHVQERCA